MTIFRELHKANSSTSSMSVYDFRTQRWWLISLQRKRTSCQAWTSVLHYRWAWPEDLEVPTHTSSEWHLKLGHTVWPWKDLMGLSTLSLQTWIHWSVLQDAKLVLVCQSTSSAGAEWNENCWVHCPDAASQIIVVWWNEMELEICLSTVNLGNAVLRRIWIATFHKVFSIHYFK